MVVLLAILPEVCRQCHGRPCCGTIFAIPLILSPTVSAPVLPCNVPPLWLMIGMCRGYPSLQVLLLCMPLAPSSLHALFVRLSALQTRVTTPELSVDGLRRIRTRNLHGEDIHCRQRHGTPCFLWTQSVVWNSTPISTISAALLRSSQRRVGLLALTSLIQYVHARTPVFGW